MVAAARPRHRRSRPAGDAALPDGAVAREGARCAPVSVPRCSWSASAARLLAAPAAFRVSRRLQRTVDRLIGGASVAKRTAPSTRRTHPPRLRRRCRPSPHDDHRVTTPTSENAPPPPTSGRRDARAVDDARTIDHATRRPVDHPARADHRGTHRGRSRHHAAPAPNRPKPTKPTLTVSKATTGEGATRLPAAGHRPATAAAVPSSADERRHDESRTPPPPPAAPPAAPTAGSAEPSRPARRPPKAKGGKHRRRRQDHRRRPGGRMPQHEIAGRRQARRSPPPPATGPTAPAPRPSRPPPRRPPPGTPAPATTATQCHPPTRRARVRPLCTAPAATISRPNAKDSAAHHVTSSPSARRRRRGTRPIT